MWGKYSVNDTANMPIVAETRRRLSTKMKTQKLI